MVENFLQMNVLWIHLDFVLENNKQKSALLIIAMKCSSVSMDADSSR
jgi:hypothetical protein